MSDRTGELERRRDGGLADLYRRHAPWLARRLRGRFGDEGEDLAQETWRKMAAAYGDGRGVRHPRALLMMVAGRLASDSAAKRARREALVEGRLAPEAEGAEAAQEAAVLLEELILGLPDDLRSVFVMSRFGGLSNAQIAGRLGISPKTVEWRMTRALAHLAAQLRR